MCKTSSELGWAVVISSSRCELWRVSVGVLNWGVSFLNHDILPDKPSQQNCRANTKLQFPIMFTQAAVQYETGVINLPMSFSSIL